MPEFFESLTLWIVFKSLAQLLFGLVAGLSIVATIFVVISLGKALYLDWRQKKAFERAFGKAQRNKSVYILGGTDSADRRVR